MNVLVTGGAGYVGSHTCKALAAEGIVPVTYDDLRTGHRAFVRWGPLVEGDVGDRDALRRVMRTFKIEAILHFGASSIVGESIENPRVYFANNVVGSICLLDVALEEGISNIVFSSTCATYGLPDAVPITEDTPQSPINPYGHSKLFVERAMSFYEKAYGLRWVALRYFNAAGADESGEVGELHHPETHLIPLAIASAVGDRGPLDILGADYPTQDGTAVRDYVHVSDLARAHVSALSYLRDGGASCPLNLGTGRGYSVREVIDCVGVFSKRAVPIRVAPRRTGDAPRLVADASRAARVLGWKPVEGLESVVRTAHTWYSRSREAARMMNRP
jgi:UDP-glucose-4-epimerase GalE